MSCFFHNPVAVHTGPEAYASLPRYLQSGSIVLLTTARWLRAGADKKIRAFIPAANWLIETIAPNPDLDVLDAQARSLRPEAISAVVALGGGSAMDGGKVLAAALAQDSAWSLREYFERETHRLPRAALPFFCIPTTAGTGAEITPFATVWDKAALKKYSLYDQSLYASAVFLDPALTLSLPWSETLSGAMDALSHSLETLWNKNATPASLALAREALVLILDFFPQVTTSPNSLSARSRLQEAATLAGMAISQNRTAIAHAISYPLTLHFAVPHGLACSFTLPALIGMVTEKYAWRRDVDRQLAVRAAELMRGLHLGRIILDFCRPDAVYALIDAMFTPERAGNFIMPVGKTDVMAILRNSLAGQDDVE